MHPIMHLAIGIIFVIIFKLSGTPFWIFILATVLMDLDHVTDLKSNKIRFNRYLWDFIGYRKVNYKSNQKSIHLFHTFEFVVLLFILSFFYNPVFYIALAFLIHIATDAIGNLWNRKGLSWLKYWFIIYYIKKRSIYNK